MSSSKNGDGRSPCCGWSGPAAEHLGGLFQHARASEESVAVYPNITKVPAYAYYSPGAPGPDVDPYPRPSSSLHEDTAGTPCEQTAHCGAPGTNQPGCDGQTVVNTFDTMTRVQMAVCMKYGHKRVQVQRRWQGRLGFTDKGNDEPNPPLSSTPGNTKFRTVSWSFSEKDPDLDSRTGNYIESFGTGTISVDALSGMITAWDISIGVRYVTFDGSGNFTGYSTTNNPLSTVTISEMWDGGVPAVYQSYIDANIITQATIYPYDAAIISRTISNDTHIISIAENTPNVVDGDGNIVSVNPTPLGLAPTLGFVFTGSITLSDPVTSADVMTDIYALKALWNLADDIVHPWRRDGFTVRAPSVDRNEGRGLLQLLFVGTVNDYRIPTAGSGTVTDPYTAWQQMAWIDPDSWNWVFPPGLDQRYAAATDLVARYDGKIRGAPLVFPITNPASVVYPNKFWDGQHSNDRLCSADDGADPPFFYTYSFGRWNIDDLMPPTATQWTKLSDESNDLNPLAPISQGHWISMLPGSSLVRCQFEAIIEQPTPSQNYYGPS